LLAKELTLRQPARVSPPGLARSNSAELTFSASVSEIELREL